MDYTAEQIEQKLKYLAGLVNDHSIHKAGQVEFRGYNNEHGGYDFTITYNNKDGTEDLLVFLNSLKEGGLIKEDLDSIPRNQDQYYKRINRNVQIDIKFGIASIIFHCDDYNPNSKVESALDKAIAIKEKEAKHTKIPIKDNAEDRTIEISTQPIPKHPVADEVSNYLAHKVKNSMHQSGVKTNYANSKPGSNNYNFIVVIKNVSAENSQILAKLINELNKKSPEKVIPAFDKNGNISGFSLEGDPGFIKYYIEKHEKFPPIEKPDIEIENRLKALVSSVNYAKAEGTGSLSYQNGDFIIAFPRSRAGLHNLKKMLGHIDIKHSINDGILNKAPEDGHYIPTASTEFNIEIKDTINIVFTPSKVVGNISLLDKAIESAKKDEEKIFLIKDPEKKENESGLTKIQQANITNINYVTDYLYKKTKAVTKIAEQNISVTYKPGNEEEKPSFIITIPDNQLTPENLGKLLKDLNQILPVRADHIKDKDGHDIISINETPTAIAGYIKRDKDIVSTHTAHTR